MNHQLSTTAVRDLLTDFGAVHPSLKAVELVATLNHEQLDVKFWDLRYSTDDIQLAVKKCIEEKPDRSQSDAVFAEKLKVIKSGTN